MSLTTFTTDRLFGHGPTVKLLQLFSCLIFLLTIITNVWGMTLPDAIGITWGTPLAQFRQMDVPIEEEWPVWGQGIAVRTGSLQKQPTNTGSLIMVFHQEHGLIKMHWASLPIQRDLTGSKGIEAFNKVKSQLIATLGPSSQSKEETNVQLHGFYGDFYQCLQETNCGQWESIWETTEGEAVILELIGLDSGAGYLQMTHQGPNLDKILQHGHWKSVHPKQEI